MKRASANTTEHPPVNGTSEHQSLSKYIQARFDECSRSQKDVAQYIVDHLDEVAFQTAEELARRANTSSSTVVRFSQTRSSLASDACSSVHEGGSKTAHEYIIVRSRNSAKSSLPRS